MTAKRDLKRRIRLRQARTGESYVTARRRVLAERDAADPRIRAAAPTGPPVGEQRVIDSEPGDSATTEHREVDGRKDVEAGAAEQVARAAAKRPPGGAIEVEDFDGAFSVVELQDATADAEQLGFRCRVALYPDVVEHCELPRLLLALRNALVAAAGDPDTARLFGMAFGVGVDRSSDPWKKPGATNPRTQWTIMPSLYGGAVVFDVDGSDGPISVVARPWNRGKTLVLRRLSALAQEVGHNIGTGARVGLGTPEAFAFAFRTLGLEHLARPNVPLETSVEDALRRALAPEHGLFVLYDGARLRVPRRKFVIGRDRKVADLVIRDGMVSRQHAAVLYRNSTYYLKDLGSTHGVTYKGMRIDNKRIDEGDVFHIGGHELRFTYLPG
jgi:hypothetical protein